MKWLLLFVTLLSAFLLGRYSKEGAFSLAEPVDVSDGVSLEVNAAELEDVVVVSEGVATDHEMLSGLLQMPSVWERSVAMIEYVARLSDAECELTARALSDLDHPNSDVLMKLVLGRWAETDREAVLEFAVSQHDSGTERGAKLLVDQAIEWARVDSQAVLTYADSLQDQTELQAGLRYAAISAMVEADPLKALDLYRSIESSSGSGMGGVLWTIVEAVANVDLARAQLELERTPKSGQQEVVSGLLAYYSKQDPAAGLVYAQSLPVGLVRADQLSYPLMANWLHKSPEQALEAVARLEPGGFQNELFSNGISTWAHRDLDATMAWVLPRIDEPLVEKAWGSLVYTLARVDPERGMQIIEANPALKESRHGLIAGWLSSDPDQALEWIEVNLIPS